MKIISGSLQCDLISDLCSASGNAHAGSVDIEICSTTFGIPYIEGKRIKGCIREAALERLSVLVCDNTTTEETLLEEWNCFCSLFGQSGDSDSGGFKIENGFVKEYKELTMYLNQMKKENSKQYVRNANPHRIQNVFTTLYTQTTIDQNTKTAQKNSLRTRRIVQSRLVAGELTQFAFDIRLEIDGEESIEERSKFAEEYFKKVCRMVHNIGSGRTRGFGEVRLQLITNPIISRTEEDRPLQGSSSLDNIKDCFPYTVFLKTPIIFSSGLASRGEVVNYIPGSAVLGFFAGAFCSEYNLKSEAHTDDDFKHLFLNDDTVFSSAFPICQGTRMVPAPMYIHKPKNESAIDNESANDFVNVFAAVDLSGEVPAARPKTKPLSGYVHFYGSPGEEKIEHYLPRTSITNHHSRPADKSVGHARGSSGIEGNQGDFFSYTALEENTEFSGHITCTRREFQIIKHLIDKRNGIVEMGHSRSAQYGTVVFSFPDTSYKKETMTLKEGQQFAVAFQTPLVLIDDTGNLSTDLRLLLPALFGKEPGCFSIEKAALRSTMISGYNAKWKFPKQQVSAWDSGSSVLICYLGKKDITICAQGFLGHRTNEGFGEYKVYSNLSQKFFQKAVQVPVNLKGDEVQLVVPEIEAYIKLINLNQLNELLQKEGSIAAKKSEKLISASLLSRISGMVDAAKKSETPYQELAEMLCAISSTSLRLKAISYLCQLEPAEERYTKKQINAAETAVNTKVKLEKTAEECFKGCNSLLLQPLTEDNLSYTQFAVYLRAYLNQTKYINRQQAVAIKQRGEV